MAQSDPLAALREALALSPDNVPLRQHLAEMLLARGELAEAETAFRQAIALAPHSAELKIGLASAFLQQGKDSAALAIVETLVKERDPAPAAFVLYARLLWRAGQIADAVAQYKLGIEQDPSVADPELSQRLGVGLPEESTAEVVDGKMRMSVQSDGGAQAELERPKVTFRDIGGMEALKEEIRLKIIYPLQHAELYRSYGKSIGGGLLMYGPPGCGKTHLARATAGEIDATFMAIGINDVLDMWIGNSERNLHELFEQARQNAPCVLFFDEVDALGARRSDMQHSGSRHLINQFLAEMDGVQSQNEGLLILAATNAPWHVDPAFRRPGRFDRVLFVSPPDLTARAEILRILCRGKPCQTIEFEQVAKKADQFSGADLKALVDLAIEGKLQEALKTGVPKPLTTADLVAAAGRVKPTTREWFSTARNYALYSNQGGTYDDILKYLKLT